MSNSISRARGAWWWGALAATVAAVLALSARPLAAQPPPTPTAPAAPKAGEPKPPAGDTKGPAAPKAGETKPPAGDAKGPAAGATAPPALAPGEEELPAESATAGGKKYQQLPVDNSLKLDAGTILRNGLAAGQEQAFEDYYRKNVLPGWTIPENYPKLPKLRQRLHNDLASTKGVGVHDRLNALLLDFMGKLAQGDYHPAVRFNAMLMIGELNTRPPVYPASPQPLPAALPVLLAALDDEKQVDAVRFGALLGVIRHGLLGIVDEPSKARVSAAMLKLATTAEVPGRSHEGQAWIRCRAIGLLAHFKSPGQDGAVAKAMVAILDEPDAPFSVRCAAARAVGELDLNPQLGLQPAEIARGLGRLARDACKEEIQQCEEHDRLLDPRKLKSRLVPVRIGLTGSDQAVSAPTGGISKLVAQANDKDKDLFKKIKEQIDTWIAKLDDKDLSAKPEPSTGPPGMPPGMGVGGGEMGMGGPRVGGMGGPAMGGPMGAGPGGLMGGPMAPDTHVETPAKAASKRILAEIKAELEKFEPLLESPAE